MNIVEPIRKKSDLKKIERILRKQSLRDLLLFTVGTNCGLRISDILNLNVGDVRGKNYINIIEKKTGKFKRFPINSKLKPLFDKFTAKRNSDEPLFLSVFNNRMERTQSYRIIRDACREVGIDYKIGTHTLRKTFGYHHYKKFKDVALLQKIFNHSSPAITLRYIGIDQEEIDEIKQALSDRNYITALTKIKNLKMMMSESENSEEDMGEEEEEYDENEDEIDEEEQAISSEDIDREYKKYVEKNKLDEKIQQGGRNYPKELSDFDLEK